MHTIPERVLNRLRLNQPTKGDKPYYAIDEHGCWIWQRGKLLGYGSIGWSDGKGGVMMMGAHRVSYVAFRGPYPDELQIDHLCCVKACVNPEHLETVTSRENTMRAGTAVSAICAAKTHCLRGHEFTEDNIYRYRGKRFCRACARMRGRGPL